MLSPGEQKIGVEAITARHLDHRRTFPEAVLHDAALIVLPHATLSRPWNPSQTATLEAYGERSRQFELGDVRNFFDQASWSTSDKKAYLAAIRFRARRESYLLEEDDL